MVLFHIDQAPSCGIAGGHDGAGGEAICAGYGRAGKIVDLANDMIPPL
jgi:uncharacterized protein YbbK (DUF523 family)